MKKIALALILLSIPVAAHECTCTCNHRPEAVMYLETKDIGTITPTNWNTITQPHDFIFLPDSWVFVPDDESFGSEAWMHH